MIAPVRKAVSMVALGTAARIEVWHMLSDLMEAEMDVERAIAVTITSFEDQGQTLKPWVLKRWRRALIDSRLEGRGGALGAGDRRDGAAGGTGGWTQSGFSRRPRASPRPARGRCRRYGVRWRCRAHWRRGS